MRALIIGVALFVATVLPTLVSAQSGGEIVPTSAEWRRLNIFFSNFAEANVQPFRENHLPAEELIRFGVLHNLINASQRIQAVPRRPGYGRLPGNHVSAAARKYFGADRVQHQSLAGDYSWIQYADGFYVFPRADGESLPFAQVANLRDAGEREYIAGVTVYRMIDEDVDRYGTPIEQLRRQGYEVEVVAQMRARIRKIREAGQDRYILLEYLPSTTP